MDDNQVIYHIYGIYNRINSKIYIGQTKQGYRKRFKQHLCPKDKSPLLNNAIKKYGKDAFSCELLDVAFTRQSANEKEKMWIAALRTYKKDNGYNLSMGGVIGDFNKETLAKMSKAKRGEKNSFYRKHHTEDAKRRMSESKKGMYSKDKHPGAKAIRCIETGVIYTCVVEAQEKTGINAKHIGQVANKRNGRKTAGGYTWEWA